MANLSLRLASPLQFDSIVDGPGIRTVLWCQGCIHSCLNCHNPQTHDQSRGTLYKVDDIMNQLLDTPLQSGITLSGGEPFLQSEALIPIAKLAQEEGKNIWAYSGFTYEELCQNPNNKLLLSYVDILVDGKFINELKDYRLIYKGSSNQRIIDVQASLHANKVVISKYDSANNALKK